MSYLKIVTGKDNETLRKKCKVITEITPRICDLLDDMTETMRRANGVGLAGPQVGVLRRIAVVETEPDEVYELINPVITKREGSQVGYEGCLSLPGQYGIVDRPMKVSVEATNRNGERYVIEAEDFLARALCHEIDHLDGVLYADIAERMLSKQEIQSLAEEDDEE